MLLKKKHDLDINVRGQKISNICQIFQLVIIQNGLIDLVKIWTMQ